MTGKPTFRLAGVEDALDSVFGLPVHALVVHFVVLVPIVAVAAVWMAIRPSFSRRFGVAVVVFAVLAFIASVISRVSGEQLASRIGYPDPHTELGNVLPIFIGVFAVLLTLFWLFDRGIPGNRRRPMWVKILAVAVVVAAILAVWWTIRVGHSGAEATWKAVIENTTLGSIDPPS
jgi:Mn2+/Fe2+ NRAMP family transporter